MHGLKGAMLILVAVLAGCSPTKYVYREITKDKDAYNTRAFHATLQDLQQAVAKVVLTKKMSIDKENAGEGTLTAFRKFSQGYQTVVVVLQSKIMPLADGQQELYLNGIQTTERNYVQDKTRFLLWLVPLPGGGGKQVSTSKEADVFIDDKQWYKDLFEEIEKVLPKPVTPAL